MTRPTSPIHSGWVLLVCCLAQFMVILDVSVVNVALPSIRADLGFSPVDLQWVVNAYTLTFAGFLLLGGRAADLLGHRRVFLAGLTLFGLASLAGALSDSQLTLVVARGVQGLGGAVVAPATLSILTTSFTEGHERNRALGYWGAMGGAGGAAGALLGGVLTEAFGWQSILLINVPIAAGIALGACLFVTARRPLSEQRRQYDVAGALTLTTGLVLVTFAIVRTNVNGWGSAATLVAMGAGVALLGIFLLIEGRLARRPLVPLRIFSSRMLSGANVVVFFLGSAVFAMWYFVSLYLQQVLGFSAIEAGLAFVPMTLAIVVASTFAGRLVARFGPGRVLSVGMALVGAGMLVFSTMRANGSYLGDVVFPSLLTAFGIGLSFVPVTIAATSGVEHADAGLASGLVNTSRQFGGSLGLALLATVASSHTASVAHGGASTASALTSGFHAAFLVGATFGLAGALTAGAALARRPRRDRAGAPADGQRRLGSTGSR